MVFVFALVVAIVAFFAAIKAVSFSNGDPIRAQAASAARKVLYGVGGLAVVIAASQWVRVIPAGHVGVIDVFGKVQATPLQAGLRIVIPWANVINMSVKTQEIKETMAVPSQEGLAVELEISVLYHLESAKAPEVYRTVGTNYADVILVPQFRSVARGVTAAYDAKALYTSAREQLAGRLADELRGQVGERGVTVEATPLRKIGLPQRLAQAIEEKLSAEQESQRMQFVLTKETQEAERKRIEAGGISDFQRIVSQGISENLLRWKGIEATLEIAKSSNAKVVVVGGGKDGLPIILGGQ